MALAEARAANKAKRDAAQRTGLPRSGGANAQRRRRWSGPGTDHRDPQPLGALVSRMADDRGWADKLSNGSVFGSWAELVGAEVAEHATPIALKDGELTVQASSTAWATQLKLLQRQLLGQIRAGVGKDVVKRLRVQGPAAPSWRYGPRHVPGRGPRDTYG
ncbi:putative nucleic acid-binding Zn ribbon protein [Crossiella equi]|uniref:Nucleic acid-binding Zn ribbon protein n=1 Tax=Crossiella equi TaxID=130796 RepID=A0ABS5AGP6_9PSEU|nr:DciA family protein [Crossiella equi]MBP2475521.1 putative nucleic acid-binding Zn ribbon protein [Crossiella equi]